VARQSQQRLIVGISDTATDNPLGESFSRWPFFASGIPTKKICQGFDGKTE
jgi:hypothetical protein